MTPLGQRLRDLRARHGINQAEMAARLGVSASYLSALERGRRGRASFELLQRTIVEFGLIWDDADELMRLAEISDPRARIDTADLAPPATEAANRLARHAARLEPSDWQEILKIVHRASREGERTLRSNGP